MSTDFQMNYHHNKDNLHVKMQGIFDGNSAHELLNLFLRDVQVRRQGVRRYGGGKRSVAVRQQGVAGRLCQTPFRRRSCSSRAKTDSTWRPPGAVCLSCRPQEEKRVRGKCAHCTCHGEHGHGHGGCACRGEHNHDH